MKAIQRRAFRLSPSPCIQSDANISNQSNENILGQSEIYFKSLIKAEGVYNKRREAEGEGAKARGRGCKDECGKLKIIILMTYHTYGISYL